MPRKRDRFSRLKQLLKDSKGVPPAGSDAEKFLNFISGKTTYKISAEKLAAIKAAGGRATNYGTALMPFNIAAPAVTGGTYFGTFTKYSKSLLGGLKAEAGHNAVDDKTLNDAAYNPAILRVAIKEGDVTKPTSQILGKSYSRQATKSGTIPFGGKAAYKELEEDRKKALLTEATKLGGYYTASYEPEEWNPGRGTGKDVYTAT